MRLQMILLLVGVAYTCCGDVDNADGIEVRIRVNGKTESQDIYFSVDPGENLKLICELISANHSATDDRLEWTKTGILRINIEDLSYKDGYSDNVAIPIVAKQKGNSSVVTFKSLSEDDSGYYQCTSRKYEKSAFIIVIGAKPIKVDQSNILRPKDNLWKPIEWDGVENQPIVNWGGADEEGIINRGGANDNDNPIVNMGGAIDTPVINYEPPKYQSSNYGYVFVVGLLACVLVAIRYCILVLCTKLRMGASSDRALLIQRTIVIRGPVGGDDVERGGVNNEGVPSNRGGASGEGEEPSNGLPAYGDVVATQVPPPSYADTVANPV